MHKMLLIALALVTAAAPAARGTTYEVWPDGRGSYPTIQSAINACAVSGDVVYLHGGVYHETGIVADGKSLTINEWPGERAYVISPSAGNGTCLTIRNTTSFTLGSISFRNFGVGTSVENATGAVQFITVQACDHGVTTSGTSVATVWYSLVDSCGTAIEVQGGSATLQNETIAHSTTGVLFSGGTATLTRTILYGCGTGVQCSGGTVSLMSCNDFYLNTANYGGCATGTNDFYTDPKFCFWASSAGPYWLHSTSPCFTKSNPCSVQVGAFTGLNPGCSGTAVERTTWGSIKNIYR